MWVHVCVYGLLSSASALELLLDTVLLWMLLRLPPNISASRAVPEFSACLNEQITETNDSLMKKAPPRRDVGGFPAEAAITVTHQRLLRCNYVASE